MYLSEKQLQRGRGNTESGVCISYPGTRCGNSLGFINPRYPYSSTVRYLWNKKRERYVLNLVEFEKLGNKLQAAIAHSIWNGSHSSLTLAFKLRVFVWPRVSTLHQVSPHADTSAHFIPTTSVEDDIVPIVEAGGSTNSAAL